jgi:hypothetical protein
VVIDIVLGVAVLALLVYRQLIARPVNASALRTFGARLTGRGRAVPGG